MSHQAIDPVGPELMALLDPWRKRPSTAVSAPDRSRPSMLAAYCARVRIGRMLTMAAWFVGSIMGGIAVLVVIGLFQQPFNWSVLAGLAAWLTLWAGLTGPLNSRRTTFTKDYREAYLQLSSCHAAQLLLDQEFWRLFFDLDGDVAARTDLIPQDIYATLLDATARWEAIQGYPAHDRRSMKTPPRWLSARLTLPTDADTGRTNLNARYAAFYDFFFDPHEAFHAALEAQQAAEDRREEEFEQGDSGV